MKILYVSQYFPPEMGAPAARAAELSRHWTTMGHDVTVLTGFPNHPTGVVPDEWRSRFRKLVWHQAAGRVHVVRTWLWPLPNRKAHERIRNYASFGLSAASTGMFLPKPDVIVGSSPQLLVALAAWWIAWSMRVPFVFEVRDLWPESLAAVGIGAETTILHRTLRAVAGFLYRRADKIAVVTSSFKDHLVRAWHLSPEKIVLAPNGVETDSFFPDPTARSLRKSLELEDRFVICYIGTMGMAHGLEIILDAASALNRDLPNAVFLFIGEGAEKDRIQQLAHSRKLENVRFMSQQPRERIPAHISAADVCLVVLKDSELFKTVIPTKLLEYLSCARPVIVAVDGEARRIVEESGGGLFVHPGDANAMANALITLAKDPSRRRTMGENGRKFIVSRYSRENTARDYALILERVVKEKASTVAPR